jgi:transcriptional regulator with XRE-family HTH domain
MKFSIEVAKRSSSKARIALCGPPGAGKTFSALELAKGMLAGDSSKIILIDSENKSAAKYADGRWKQLVLPDCSLKTYTDAIRFSSSRCGVLIIDSLSHAWMGPGGALEQAESEQSRARNKMEAWRVVTPLQLRLLKSILDAPCHVIATMRTKDEWVFDRNDKGRTVPRKVGTKPVQRDGVEYEFDVVGYLSSSHTLSVTKTRCPELDGLISHRPTAELGEKILGWLSDSDEPERVEPSAPKAAAPKPSPPKEAAPKAAVPKPLAPEPVAPSSQEFDGSWLRKLRKRSGLTQAEVSSLSGISTRLISDHEQSKRQLSGPVFEVVVSILDTAIQNKHEKTLTRKGVQPQTVEPEAEMTPSEALDRIQELFGVDRESAWTQYFLPELREQFEGKVSKENLSGQHVRDVMDVLEDLGEEARGVLDQRSRQLSELTAILQSEAENTLLLRCDLIGPRFAKNIETAFKALTTASIRSEESIF